MRKIFTGILSLVIALVTLEVLSRVGWTWIRDRYEAREKATDDEWFAYSKSLGWARKPHFDGMIADVRRTFDGDGFLAGDAAKFRNSTLAKILFVGDSNTFGNDCPVEKTFVALVDSMLPDAVTVNAGFLGYSSFQGKIILDDYLERFRPDLVVISFNYNDRRYVAPPDLPDGKEAFERMFSAAENAKLIALFENSYIFRSLRLLMRKVGLLGEEPVPAADVDTVPARVGPEEYRNNLRSMALKLKAKRIPVIFIVMSDNPIHTHYLRVGVEQLERSQPDSAIENLKIQTHQRTLFTVLARKYLKHAYAQLGKSDDVRRVGTIEKPVRSIFSGFPIYLDSEYNDIMREVGQELAVPVIEAGATLNKRPSVYYDFCHFDTTGHRMIAELLTSHIRPLLSEK